MTKPQIAYFLLALTLLAGACAPAPQPTVDAQAAANQIGTSVAQTVEAGLILKEILSQIYSMNY